MLKMLYTGPQDVKLRLLELPITSILSFRFSYFRRQSGELGGWSLLIVTPITAFPALTTTHQQLTQE